MNQEDKRLIYEFIHDHQLTVLATVDKNNNPEAAVIEFGDTPDLEIIFDTLAPSYRKYQNLKLNPQVAFVIGWENDITVQYEGVAREVAGSEKENYKKQYFQKNPDAEKWDSNPEIKYFIATPTWIRYADYSKRPFRIIELKF